MNNFQQIGNVLTLTAPTGGVVSGLGYKIGQLFVVAKTTVAETLPFEGQVVGVIELVKDAGTAWTEGQLLYWDDTDSNVTTVVAGNLLIGGAAGAAASDAVVGDVRLNAVAVDDDESSLEQIFGEDLGQPNLEDDNYFLISTVMLATAYVLDQTALPADNPPRNIIITHTVDTTADTLGDAVVTGTNVDDEVITETLTIASGTTVVGTAAFKTVTQVITEDWVQVGGVSDLIEVGFDTLLGLSKVRAASTEIWLGFLAGVARLPDAVVADADDVEENTVSLTGGTYDGSKTAKVLIKV